MSISTLDTNPDAQLYVIASLSSVRPEEPVELCSNQACFLLIPPISGTQCYLRGELLPSERTEQSESDGWSDMIQYIATSCEKPGDVVLRHAVTNASDLYTYAVPESARSVIFPAESELVSPGTKEDVPQFVTMLKIKEKLGYVPVSFEKERDWYEGVQREDTALANAIQLSVGVFDKVGQEVLTLEHPQDS
ncbi:hypothetical protein EHS25_008271 [Saitozyma podzolica]|uniref:Uncharacterized protein n=1 Tax=Saitozyma podzolica TaxID=1890683 RepID=A0A427YP31_9TREE|nr:hypothetical protein EHS25_008271 [Saitozyma podzolica]